MFIGMGSASLCAQSLKIRPIFYKQVLVRAESLGASEQSKHISKIFTLFDSRLQHEVSFFRASSYSISQTLVQVPSSIFETLVFGKLFPHCTIRFGFWVLELALRR